MAYNLGFIVLSNLRNMLQLFFLKCWNLINAVELWLVDHSSLRKKLEFSNNLSNMVNIDSIVQPCDHDQLIKIVAEAALHHPDVLHNILSISTCSATSGKLFIGRLGDDITSEMLHHHFSEYGEIEDAFVALDKTTGRSKGYGFVFFKNNHSALLALRQPYKKVNGKSIVIRPYRPGITTTITQKSSVSSLWARLVFVSNVPQDMSPHRLFEYFSSYGEIEKGPMGFDKTTGKFNGSAVFVYKTAEGAKAAISDPSKTIDGYHLTCKLAEDGSNFFKKQPSFPPSGSIPGHWICGLGSHQSLNPPICFNHSCGCGAGPGFSSARSEQCPSPFCPNHGRLSSYGNNINAHGCGYTASCCVPPASTTVGMCNECVDPSSSSSSSSCWLSNFPRHNQQVEFTPLTGVHDQLRSYHSFFSH